MFVSRVRGSQRRTSGRHYITERRIRPRSGQLTDARNQPASARAANADLAAFVATICAAKLGTAEMYAILADRMPSLDATLAVRELAAEEKDHARRLLPFVGGSATAVKLHPAVPLGCGLSDESWPSSLMATFALDQAATAALVGIASLHDCALAETAAAVAAEERRHQAFAIGAFRSVTDADPSKGLALAREMIVARDWVKQVFPRHATLAALAAGGVLPAEAAKIHDSFLAGLGDRVQVALGVLGDL